MSQKKLPDYEKPPLAEVVMGVKFKPLPGIKVPHYGLFWEPIKKEFPSCQHAPVLGDLGELTESEVGSFPVPRLWLINKVGDYLIQLQKNHFFFNWRKRDNVYPRFERIAPQFYEHFRNFKTFCGKNNLGEIVPEHFELSYINHILINEGWSKIEEIGRLFPDLKWRNDKNRFLGGMITTQWISEFRIPKPKNVNNRVQVKVSHGQKRQEQIPLLILEIKVRGVPSEVSEITEEASQEKWFKEAHDTILWTFEDFTDIKVQKEVWKKKNGK